MGWEIETTDCFDEWLLRLPDREQIAELAMVFVLEQQGPKLARPYADSIRGTRHIKNLKELRVQSGGVPYRVFYAFDPDRKAVLLCGGRKDGGGTSRNFYTRMISLAESEFVNYLNTKE